MAAEIDIPPFLTVENALITLKGLKTDYIYWIRIQNYGGSIEWRCHFRSNTPPNGRNRQSTVKHDRKMRLTVESSMP